MYTEVAKNINNFKLEYPNTIVPSPNSVDYDNGFIERYFIRKANDSNGFLYEVNFITFTKYLKNPFWIGENLKWRITGPVDPVYNQNGILTDIGVRSSNRESTLIAANKIKNIGLYLPNLLQVHK